MKIILFIILNAVGFLSYARPILVSESSTTETKVCDPDFTDYHSCRLESTIDMAENMPDIVEETRLIYTCEHPNKNTNMKFITLYEFQYSANKQPKKPLKCALVVNGRIFSIAYHTSSFCRSNKDQEKMDSLKESLAFYRKHGYMCEVFFPFFPKELSSKDIM